MKKILNDPMYIKDKTFETINVSWRIILLGIFNGNTQIVSVSGNFNTHVMDISCSFTNQQFLI